ncbi:hypothetical protein BC826DRAFT_1110208 [Russula brevipes]|nr:hypothetical protein BC826DRAFT_1110208 [Russula brevipes]
MITQAGNADKHPGNIDRLSGVCRPKEVVAAERAAKAAVKEMAAAMKESGIQKVAQIENNARKRRATNLQANHLKDKLTVPRVARARKPVDGQGANVLENSMIGMSRIRSAVDNSDGELLTDEELPDRLTSSVPKGTSLNGSGEKSLEERSVTSEDSECDMDLEEETPDTTIKKTSGKKQKKGIAVRTEINSAAAQMVQGEQPNVEVRKRKSGLGTTATEAQMPRTKKQKSSSSTQELSGLVPGWKKAKAPQASNLSRAPSSASTRTMVSRRASSTVATDHELEDGAITSASASDGDPAFGYGGIPSDEEEVERPGLQYGAPLTNRYRSLAKIEDIHVAPLGPKPGQLNNNTGRTRIRNTHLPVGTTDRFTKNVLPIALDTAGALSPWDVPDDQQMVDIWNLVFGSPNDYPLVDGDGDLFIAVKGLIKRGISTWLHKFTAAAEKALSTKFDRQGFMSIDERAEFVQLLLGDVDDISSKHRPFLWKSAYENIGKENTRLEGIFQGRLVARTFLEHILATSSVEDKHRVLERPVGALILSIQVVHRALLYSVEGSFKPLGSNETTTKRALVFLKRIMTLKDQQWDDIYKAALVMQEHNKHVDVGERDGDGGIGGSSDDDDDDDLFDPLYDDIPDPSSSTVDTQE